MRTKRSKLTSQIRYLLPGTPHPSIISAGEELQNRATMESLDYALEKRFASIFFHWWGKMTEVQRREKATRALAMLIFAQGGDLSLFEPKIWFGNGLVLQLVEEPEESDDQIDYIRSF